MSDKIEAVRIEAGVYVSRGIVATFDLILDVRELKNTIVEYYGDDPSESEFVGMDEIEDWVFNNTNTEDILSMMTQESKDYMHKCYELFGKSTTPEDYYDTYIKYVLEEGEFITPKEL